MLLAIDVGNTKIALGIFNGEKLQTTLRIATSIHRLADEYALLLLNLLPYHSITLRDIQEAILCSVVPPLVPVFEEVCHTYFNISPLIVEPGIKTGVRLNMDNPKEVGPDRIANAVAAYRLYGGPAIIIDFGTATTFDVISKEGDYLGGAIAPGMEIATEALYNRTAKLPRVELVPPKRAIARDTTTAIQSGVIFGYIGMVEGLTDRLQRELIGKARIIATGSYAELIAQQTRVIEEVNPNLTLFGLRYIYNLNKH
jgi:type III pantothenate kinase